MQIPTVLVCLLCGLFRLKESGLELFDNEILLVLLNKSLTCETTIKYHLHVLFSFKDIAV